MPGLVSSTATAALLIAVEAFDMATSPASGGSIALLDQVEQALARGGCSSPRVRGRTGATSSLKFNLRRRQAA